ncbi:hypothetical protein GQ457_09G031320 [Hibiscus cannabinus]
MASSSSSSRRMKHHVFLSFRGEDTRLNFTAHLLEALERKGLDVFFDEKKLERGEELSPALSRAISASSLFIIILSPDYASSKSCLTELSDIMDRKDNHGQIVLPIFYHVDPSHVRNLGGSFKASFDEHESKGIDQVHQWKKAFVRVGKLKGWHIQGGKFDRPDTEYIKDVIEYAIKKLNSKSRSVSEDWVGIDDQKRVILSLIEQQDIRVIGLWGPGGIGKTTLAQAVHDEISPKFQTRLFLHNVREEMKNKGMKSVRNEFLSKLLEDEIEIDTPTIGINFIKERLNNKRVFVVLDDVDDSDQIDCMGIKYYGVGSKIVVSSRDRQVLKNGGADKIYEVKKLNENDSLQLFTTFAFKLLNPPVDFRDLSRTFVRYAQGSPLALKVLGSKLHTKSRLEWESEVDRLKGYAEPKLSQILKSSFDGLDELEKNIFLDVAFFFKGKLVDGVEKILSSCYMGAVCGISKLIDKCLLEIVNCDCISMHDMLEEMGKDIVRQESKHPGNRSRLWSSRDVYQVLNYNKDLVNLRVIDVSYSKNLKKIPNLLGAINLKILDCAECESLVEIPSIRHLTSLREFNIFGCSKVNKFPELPNNLSELDLSSTGIEEVPDSIQHLLTLEMLNLSGTLVKTVPINILKLESLQTIDLSFCPMVEFPEILTCFTKLDLPGTEIEEVFLSFHSLSILQSLNLSFSSIRKVCNIPLSGSREIPTDDALSTISSSKSFESLEVNCCGSLELLSELPPYMRVLHACECLKLKEVSFADQNLYPFDSPDRYVYSEEYLMLFFECFSLNQVSIDNIEANAMLKIGFLAKKWIARRKYAYDRGRLVCCFPGDKISANMFKFRSNNSRLNLKIAPNECNGRRFLAFAICLVVDLTQRYHRWVGIKFVCDYQLTSTGGDGSEMLHSEFYDEFYDELSELGPRYIGEHVLILFNNDMIHEDKNYEEASFEFYIKSSCYDEEENETEDDEIYVDQCGVHVCYVDAESNTDKDWMSNERFSSSESFNSDEMRNDESNNNFDSQEDANIEKIHDNCLTKTRPAENKRSFVYDGEEGDGGHKSKTKVISGDLSYLGPVENEGTVFAKLVAVKTSLEVFLEANWTGKEILMVQSNSQFQLVSSDMIYMADSLAKLGIQRSETFRHGGNVTASTL